MTVIVTVAVVPSVVIVPETLNSKGRCLVLR